MGKAATITVRVDEELKLKIQRRAERERRSVSAQIEHELETAFLGEETSDVPAKAGSFLGRYEGTKVPSDRDFREVREMLWGRLQRSS